MKAKISASSRHLGIVLAGICLLFGQAAQAADPTSLRVLNWSDYIDPAVVQQFEKDSGVKVEYQTFESVEDYRRRLGSDQPPYDVVVPPISELARGIGRNLYLNLDKSQIPSAASLDPVLMKQLARIDDGNRRGLPYLWGTVGLGLASDKVKARIPEAEIQDSWRLLFDVRNAKRLSSCGIAIIDSPEDVIPLVLHYLGRSPTSLDPADYLDVERLLSQIAPQVTAFTSDYIEDFAAGKYCLVLGYSGDVLQAAAKAKEAGSKSTLSYVIPREGSSLWFDMLAIPKNARAPQMAHRFIDYVLKGENMARISNFTAYANAQPSSLGAITPEIKNNPAIYPDDVHRQSLFLTTLSAHSLDGLRQKIWQSVKRKLKH